MKMYLRNSLYTRLIFYIAHNRSQHISILGIEKSLSFWVECITCNNHSFGLVPVCTHFGYFSSLKWNHIIWPIIVKQLFWRCTVCSIVYVNLFIFIKHEQFWEGLFTKRSFLQIWTVSVFLPSACGPVMFCPVHVSSLRFTGKHLAWKFLFLPLKVGGFGVEVTPKSHVLSVWLSKGTSLWPFELSSFQIGWPVLALGLIKKVRKRDLLPHLSSVPIKPCVKISCYLFGLDNK